MSTANTQYSITIPDDRWARCDDATPPQQLLCTLVINGTSHHLTALRAELVDNWLTLLTPLHDWAEDVLNSLQLVYEGCYELTTIGGYTYIVYAVPFAD